MSIQILENTLLKLLVRRGSDFDRKQITLETGELGYSTDNKRLYIGDGVTKGGIIVGNKWAGNAADLTSLAPAASGDFAYDTDNRCFKILTKGTGSVAADWVTVATFLSAFNTSITIDANNRISVGTLSAGNFSLNAIGSSLTIDGSEKIALSSTISVDNITQRSTGLTDYLTLPAKLGDQSHSLASLGFPSNLSHSLSTTSNIYLGTLPLTTVGPKGLMASNLSFISFCIRISSIYLLSYSNNLPINIELIGFLFQA